MSANARSSPSTDSSMTSIESNRTEYTVKPSVERPSSYGSVGRIKSGAMVVKVPSKYTNAIQRRQESDQNCWQGEVKYNNGGTVVSIPRRATQLPLGNWAPELKPDTKGGFLPVLGSVVNATTAPSASQPRSTRSGGSVRPLGATRDLTDIEFKKKPPQSARAFLYPEREAPDLARSMTCLEFQNGVLNAGTASGFCNFTGLESALSVFSEMVLNEKQAVKEAQMIREAAMENPEIPSLKASDYKKVLAKSQLPQQQPHDTDSKKQSKPAQGAPGNGVAASNSEVAEKSKPAQKSPSKQPIKGRARYGYLTINAMDNSWTKSAYNKYNVSGRKESPRGNRQASRGNERGRPKPFQRAGYNSNRKTSTRSKVSASPSSLSESTHFENSRKDDIRKADDASNRKQDGVDGESDTNKVDCNHIDESSYVEGAPEIQSHILPGDKFALARLKSPSENVSNEYNDANVSDTRNASPPDGAQTKTEEETMETGSTGSGSVISMGADSPTKTVKARRSVRFSMEKNKVREFSPWEPIQWR